MIPTLTIFYFRFIGIEKYKELSFLVKMFLTLSHGKASVELSSSLNKPFLNHNFSEDWIVAEEAIRDHMLPNGVEPQ